tara:strand:- start:4447 stop:5850 length:1404 start_codon:yes stop_codon:yes gene_type:complete
MDHNSKLGIVILAAGQGTRMKSKTPKVLHNLAGKPLLSYVLEKAKTLADEENIFIVCGSNKDKIQKLYQNYKKINWVYQEKQLGTAHSLQQALEQLKKSKLKLDKLLVLYADVPLVNINDLNQLLDINSNNIKLLTIVADNPYGLGRIIRNNNKITGIIEEKDANKEQKLLKEINTGIAVYPVPEIFKWVDQVDNNNSQKEYYLTDVIKIAVKDNCDINSVLVSPKDFIAVQGVNSRYQLQLAERYLQKILAYNLLEQGVSLADIDKIEIRGNIKTGIDNYIDINNVFIGNIELGDNCIIEPNCYLKNVKLSNNVVIKANSYLENVSIESNCNIGPFARLRPETIIKSNSQIGNFVEIKKSIINKFSKINHLSYIGDSIIGERVNIGAGTITCNYDGVNKHQTVIEDGAFIGSNSSLIAPVVIEKNATVGAGSIISKLAPKDSLTLTRAKQKTISSWKRPEKKDQNK